MEENDYIQLNTLIAKLEVAISKEFLYHDEHLSDSFKISLENLQEGARLIKQNLFVEVGYETKKQI